MKAVGVYLILSLLCLGVSGNELGQLLLRARSVSPALEAQRAIVVQKLHEHNELAEFMDASLYASLGYANRHGNLPLPPEGYSQVSKDDSLEGSAGILVPIQFGANFAAGAVLRRWYEPEDRNDAIYQDLMGVNFQIPLLRDRGFSLYSYKRQAAMAGWNAAVCRLKFAEQQLRHSVEQAYINACEASCAYAISREATRRLEQLVEEAKELSRLKSIPDYQLQETIRDLQTGREDEEIALSTVQIRLIELATAVGDGVPLEKVDCTVEEFFGAPKQLTAPAPVELEDACSRRGELQAIAYDREQTEAEIKRYHEEQRSDLKLEFGVHWQADSDSDPWPQYRYYRDHNWGGEVMLTWSRPLGFQGSAAREARFKGRLQELAATERGARIALGAELRLARLKYNSARRRLSAVTASIGAAEATLAAEQERFRLGEGSSNEVLDAQNNLTAIRKRLAAATAELLRAYSSLNYASGYPPPEANDPSTSQSPSTEQKEK